MPYFRSARKQFLALIRSWEFRGRLPFNKNSGLKFLKFHVPNERYIPVAQTRPKPPRVFGYCSCKQDTKERYWGQQFCQMERDISVQPTEMSGQVKVDHFQRWSHNTPVESNRNGPFHLISNRNFRNFGLNGKHPECH